MAIENGKPWVVGRDYWVGDRVPPVKPMKPRVYEIRAWSNAAPHGEWTECLLWQTTSLTKAVWLLRRECQEPRGYRVSLVALW